MFDDINARVAVWREKARNNQLTQDEMKEAIQFLRQGRTSASAANEKTRERKATARAKANVNSEDLLSELDNI